jgi:hypothetical protein
MKIEERNGISLLDYLIKNIKVVLYEIEDAVLNNKSHSKDRKLLTSYIQMILDGLTSNLTNNSFNFNTVSMTYWYYILLTHQLIELITQIGAFNYMSILGLFTNYSLEASRTISNPEVTSY